VDPNPSLTTGKSSRPGPILAVTIGFASKCAQIHANSPNFTQKCPKKGDFSVFLAKFRVKSAKFRVKTLNSVKFRVKNINSVKWPRGPMSCTYLAEAVHK
jgi:hypothetical protein